MTLPSTSTGPGDRLPSSGQARNLPPNVAFDFRAVGWREFGYDYDDPPHYGRPSEHSVSPGDVTSIYVHAWDQETGEDHFFWVHSYLALQSWENWLDLIGLSLEMHGMSLA